MRERILIALIVIALIAMPVVALIEEFSAEQGLQRSAKPGLLHRLTAGPNNPTDLFWLGQGVPQTP
jgi:hypothetical protein